VQSPFEGSWAGQELLAAIVGAPAGKYRDVTALARQRERQFGAVLGGRSHVRMETLVEEQDTHRTKSTSVENMQSSAYMCQKGTEEGPFFTL